MLHPTGGGGSTAGDPASIAPGAPAPSRRRARGERRAARCAGICPAGVYLIDTPGYTNTMVIGTKNPSQLADFAKNIEVERSDRPQSPIVTIGEDAIAKGDIREVAPGPKVFTDDLAPVEDLIDRILLDYARKGGS